MPWALNGDGLILSGQPHWNSARMQTLLADLLTAPNHPETVCREIENVMQYGCAGKDFVCRLSTWCFWPHDSQHTARAIAKELFCGHVCRRMWDIKNKPIPDQATADADYDAWLQLVASSPCQPSPPPPPPAMSVFERIKAARAKAQQEATATPQAEAEPGAAPDPAT